MSFDGAQINPESLSVVLATDCGSTTTKAILFEKTESGWRQTFRGEAPTTVEKPVADVTIGAKNAFRELEELSGRKILKPSYTEAESPFIVRNQLDSHNSQDGIDLYISTSSAGGGLQMVVAGAVKAMSAASAERAALGAGAIVMDAISFDDGREQHERIAKVRHIRPDIVLLAGGTDGGTVAHPLELAEMILQANPRPRFGETLKLPVIYAGNKEAAEQVRLMLNGQCEVVIVGNLRPTLEEEKLADARDTIHELFLHHVMSHAPGYKKLLSYSPLPIIPTPAAVGDMVLSASKQQQIQILAVDIGGATTDVFSVFNQNNNSQYEHEFEPVFHRTVSANLGMSYSVANVILEAGEQNILRWFPYPIDKHELRDRLKNKMIRPTTIPQTYEDLLLEQAVCREALRLAFLHHKRLAVGLKGSKHKQRSFRDMFSTKDALEFVDMMKLDLIIGSGGVLSHAPNRKSVALMLIDAYEPLGVTQLAVDSIFMMPHLGVLSRIHPQAASEILHRDCLIELGVVIAPTGIFEANKPACIVSLENQKAVTVAWGEIVSLKLGLGESSNIEVTPLSRYTDVGRGAGKKLTTKVRGGHAGVIIDVRGRPIVFPKDSTTRINSVKRWQEAIAG